MTVVAVTPFMDEVRGVLDGETPSPARRELSDIEPVAAGAHRQLNARALAEQLVSEANAVLADHGEVITLVDDTGPGALAFTLGYGGRATRVETTFADRSTIARLIDGTEGEPRRLVDDAEVAAVVLELLVDHPPDHRR